MAKRQVTVAEAATGAAQIRQLAETNTPAVIPGNDRAQSKRRQCCGPFALPAWPENSGAGLLRASAAPPYGDW